MDPNQTQIFLAEVEHYLDATGISASEFGEAVLNDRKFVKSLRAGRAPTLRVVDRVLEYMRENRP